MEKYDAQRERILCIKGLKVLAGKGDKNNFFAENMSNPSVPCCFMPSYNTKDIRKTRYYDILYSQKTVINLYYRSKRYKCTSCKKTVPLPKAFAAPRAHYTFRFEDWVSQFCLVDPFASVARVLTNCAPPIIDTTYKGPTEVISESGVKKVFTRWLKRQDSKYLENFDPPLVLGIHKSFIKKREVFLLTEAGLPKCRLIIWLAESMNELKRFIHDLYKEAYPRQILVDWDPAHLLIDFAQKEFPKSEIMIDYKRVPLYMRECIVNFGDGLNETALDNANSCIRQYEELLDRSYDGPSFWENIRKYMSEDVFATLWSCSGNIKNSLYPTRIETDNDYWPYIDDISDMLDCDFGCSTDTVRARMLYKKPRKHGDNSASSKMTEYKAAGYFSYVSLHAERYVFPRVSLSQFANEPFDPLTNCMYDELLEVYLGVPFETAARNLRETINYHEAYQYYLDHAETVLGMLSEIPYDIDD